LCFCSFLFVCFCLFLFVVCLFVYSVLFCFVLVLFITYLLIYLLLIYLLSLLLFIYSFQTAKTQPVLPKWEPEQEKAANRKTSPNAQLLKIIVSELVKQEKELTEDWIDIILTLAHKSIHSIKRNVRQGDDMNIREYVRVSYVCLFCAVCLYVCLFIYLYVCCLFIFIMFVCCFCFVYHYFLTSIMFFFLFLR
jgi:Flp pilus assembly protein TadB